MTIEQILAVIEPQLRRKATRRDKKTKALLRKERWVCSQQGLTSVPNFAVNRTASTLRVPAASYFERRAYAATVAPEQFKRHPSDAKVEKNLKRWLLDLRVDERVEHSGTRHI